MKLKMFRFDLPDRYIAYFPPESRDDSKLMVVRKGTGEITHHKFGVFSEFFDEGDLIVVNDTKVFPSSLKGFKEKNGDEIKILLLRELNPANFLWDAIVEPARKIRAGNRLLFDDGNLVAEVIDNTTSGGRTVKFVYSESVEEFHKLIHRIGVTPLPKRLRRDPTERDELRYQTIFANNVGAISVPSAGLHFNHFILKKLEIKGVDTTPITLHINRGILNTIQVEDLNKLSMESEPFQVLSETAERVNRGINERKCVCAVGISTFRALESSVTTSSRLKATDGWTDRFMVPPYDSVIPNALLTNFHLPGSPVLVMGAAFTGYDLMMKAYKEALEHEYRFFVYGDAMLVLP